MPDDPPLALAFTRIVELAHARDLVPEDGSGLDGVVRLEVESPDYEKDWVVLANAEGEELEADLTEDRTETIPGWAAQVWWGTDLVLPAMIVGPYHGQQLHAGDEFGGRTPEDQFIRDVETELEERGFDYQEEPVEEQDAE